MIGVALALQVAVVALVVWAATRLLGQRVPGVRYALLAVLIVKLGWPVPWRAPTAIWPSEGGPATLGPGPWLEVPFGWKADEPAPVPDADERAARLSTVASVDAAGDLPEEGSTGRLVGALVAAWAIGAAVRLAQLVAEARALAGRARRARPLAVDAPRHVRVGLSPDIDTPISFGVLRPTILLPLTLAEDDATRRAVLAHERTHLRHRDPLVALVVAVLGALWWFHPAAWWLEREVRRTQEDLVDDAVVRDAGGANGLDRTTYCEALLDVARRALPGARTRLTCGSGGEPALTRRFHRLLEPKTPLHRTTHMLMTTLPLALALTLLPHARSTGADPSPAWQEAGPTAPSGQRVLEHSLAWLVGVQASDGSFQAAGTRPDDEADALAVIALIGAGNSHLVGPQARSVARGVARIQARVGAGNEAAPLTCAQALDAYVLAELSMLTETAVEGLDAALARVIEAMRRQQRVDPRVAYWSMLALASARDAGIDVPGQLLDAVSARVGWYSAADGAAWRDAHHAAAALLLHALSGQSLSDGRVADAAERILSAAETGAVDAELDYLGSYALYQLGGESWQRWRRATLARLESSQAKDGSWPAEGGSPVAATALRALALEAAWRYARVLGKD